jgi:hypothetical protein
VRLADGRIMFAKVRPPPQTEPAPPAANPFALRGSSPPWGQGRPSRGTAPPALPGRKSSPPP